MRRVSRAYRAIRQYFDFTVAGAASRPPTHERLWSLKRVTAIGGERASNLLWETLGSVMGDSRICDVSPGRASDYNEQ